MVCIYVISENEVLAAVLIFFFSPYEQKVYWIVGKESENHAQEIKNTWKRLMLGYTRSKIGYWLLMIINTYQ